MKRTSIVALDHVSLSVRRLASTRKFYEAALGAIGMKVNMDVGDALGMGSKKEKVFWLAKSPKATGDAHFAFRVENREEVDAFYAAAVRAGGQDNGPPGPRPRYGRSYYAAFVHDPEGNNIEVVCYANGGSANGGRRAKTARTARTATRGAARKTTRRRV
jgi:catechol 2,3-dioxygenase-like lactoylglutathione lyase family enzyme